MADDKDDTTSLEYLVAGLVTLFFGLLYYLLNQNSGFWPGNDQSILADSGSGYDQEVTGQQRGMAAWLEKTPQSEPTTITTKTTEPTSEPEKQEAVVAREVVVPEPDTQLTDAIAQQQEQTAQLQSSLNDELAKLKSEVARQKAEINQLKQAATGQAPQMQPADMQEVVRAQEKEKLSFESELQHMISTQQTNRAITFDKIYFDTGSAKLKPSSLPQIEAVAKQLMSNQQTKILIRGHSDNTGSAQQNSLLSLSRSGSMKNALSKLGVNPERIKIEGIGPLEPIASNETRKGRERNRRIELIIIE